MAYLYTVKNHFFTLARSLGGSGYALLVEPQGMARLVKDRRDANTVTG